MSTIQLILMYVGFALWFIAGYSTGKFIERRNQFKEKIKRQLKRTRKDWFVEIK